MIQTSPPRPPSPPEGPPKGTNFSRRNATTPLPPFPATAFTRHSSTKRTAAPYHSRRMAARILIVDDNISLAANLRDVLEGARELDVDVALAPDGQSGLAA